MKSQFAFVLSVLSVLSAKAHSDKLEDRLGIMNGTVIQAGEAIAKSIIILRNRDYDCTGVMLAPNVLMTASHCVVSDGGKDQSYEERKREMKQEERKNRLIIGFVRRHPVVQQQRKEDDDHPYNADE